MITELRIADLGVISEAAVEPHPGLTVVTGETGAGKTMIVTGLGLLLGGRTDPSAVRHGSERARVEGRFGCADPALVTAVTEAGGEIEDGELLVARQVTASGRSRAFLGGAQVPAPVCARVIETLIAIHGQSEQVRLRSADRQRELLDRFAGESVAGPLEAYRQAWAERRAASAELDRLRAEAQSRAREIDLLRFGLSEIEAVTPEPGEDTRLAAEATRLQSADDLRLVAEQALVAVAGAEDEAGGALSDVTAARKAVERWLSTRCWRTGAPVGRGRLRPGRDRRRPGRIPQRPRGRAGPAGADRRAPVPAVRAHSQVRQQCRRGAGLGLDRSRPTHRARRR